jgi:hypothetical protein
MTRPTADTERATPSAQTDLPVSDPDPRRGAVIVGGSAPPGSPSYGVTAVQPVRGTGTDTELGDDSRQWRRWPRD